MKRVTDIGVCLLIYGLYALACLMPDNKRKGRTS